MKSNTAVKSMSNRREFVRVIPDRNDPVRVNINGEGFIEVTNAVDISEGGIRLRVKHRFAGCAVDLPANFIIHLPAPVNKHFSFKGRIKHVLDDSFGVQFVALKDADLAMVKRYVKSRGAEPEPRGFFRNLFRFAR